MFDIEGTDSEERGEDRMTFEQTTSLLALALADVLIINLWAHDIGRYHGSNYDLLERVLKVNLKLFGQQGSHKRLCLVIRDFSSKSDKEIYRKKMFDFLEGIWRNVYKDEQHKNAVLSDFFEIETNFLYHKEFEEPLFDQSCKDLAVRFDVGHEDSLFP